MNHFLRKNHSPIVIDIQPSHLAAVQLVRDAHEWKPLAHATIRRSDTSKSLMPDDAEWAALDDALKRRGAIGREVALLAPGASTRVEFIELPPRTAVTPIEDLARAEIARLARWDDHTNFQLQCWDVPPPLRRATSDAAAPCALGVAALPDLTSMELIESLDARHWSVVSVIPSPLAAVKSVAKLEGLSLVVEISASYSALTVIRENVPLYHRQLPDNGIGFLIRGLIAELQLSEADAISAIELGTLDLNDAGSRAQPLCRMFADSLASEIDATIEFCLRRYGELSIRRLKLCGLGANIGGLAELLRSRFDISEPCVANVVSPLHELAAFAGRWILEEKSSQALLPVVQRDMLARQRTAKRWIACVSSAATIGLSVLGALYFDALITKLPHETQLQAIAREQLQLDAEKSQTAQSLLQMRALGDFQNRIIHQPDPSGLLQLLGRLFDDSTVLADLSVSEPSVANAFQHLRITGTAMDGTRLNDQVNSFRAMDIFANVQLLRTSRSVAGDGVLFEMTLDLVAPGGKAKS